MELVRFELRARAPANFVGFAVCLLAAIIVLTATLCVGETVTCSSLQVLPRSNLMNVYIELTHAFNATGLNAVLSSGQAVVFHRLAIMSKDGDWILAKRNGCFIAFDVLQYGASYRFGAPLDLRWWRGGWSAHLEFRRESLRVRTDFVTRPPRLSSDDLEKDVAPPGGPRSAGHRGP